MWDLISELGVALLVLRLDAEIDRRLDDATHEPRTGAMLRFEGFIFISSPRAVTPLHFDLTHYELLAELGAALSDQAD